MNASLAAAVALLVGGQISGPRPSRPTTPQPGAFVAARPPIAVITFRAAAEVQGRVVTLGDIAVLESTDQRLAARLGAVDVGAAPLPGRSRAVSAAYAQVRIRQIGVDVSRLQFHGAALVSVSRTAQTLPGSSLEKAAREAVEAANAGTVAQLYLTLTELRLPAGALELKVEGARPVAGSSGSITVRVIVDGHEEARVPVSFRLLRRAATLIAVRDLPAGHLLSETDLKVEERPALGGPLSLGDPSQAIGQEAAVPIRGGTALAASMLRPAVMVKRGSRIRLICRGPGFVATVTGEALENGIAGQPIRVRNLTSLRAVTGVVTDGQTAEVPF